ncbi:hypothetical protein I7331_32140 [Frankia sp. AgB1.8]|nr:MULTISPECIES: hypothetical protein [unclassified Frankia]MBL7623817.1 hypothetical protein [Frankia sp. AgB1.8]
MARARHRTETRDHLLVDEQHWRQQHHQPQQPEAVVLSGLRVQRQATGVVVGDHHDHPEPHHRGERRQPAPQRRPRAGVEHRDGAPRLLDVTAVRTIQQRPALRREPKDP